MNRTIVHFTTDESSTSSGVTSKSGDNWNQLSFTAEPGEEFSITVRSGETEVVKKFTV